jgi:hypothetical protein
MAGKWNGILCAYSDVRGVTGSTGDRIKVHLHLRPPPLKKKRKIHYFLRIFWEQKQVTLCKDLKKSYPYNLDTRGLPSRSVILNLGYAYPQRYKPGYLGVREKKRIMSVKGAYVDIYIWNNLNYINYKYFANIKGTIHWKRLPTNTPTKEFWELLF